MKIGKWVAVIVTSSVALSFGSCVTDLVSYASETFTDYLPDFLDSLLGTA